VLIWVMCVSKAIRVKLIRFFFQISEFLIICITIYKWGANKIFNNTHMVTGFTGFRRWLARLRLSSHILVSPVKTLFTMVVMWNTINSCSVIRNLYSPFTMDSSTAIIVKFEKTPDTYLDKHSAYKTEFYLKKT
jgi:hypothetical protein